MFKAGLVGRAGPPYQKQVQKHWIYPIPTLSRSLAPLCLRVWSLLVADGVVLNLVHVVEDGSYDFSVYNALVYGTKSGRMYRMYTLVWGVVWSIKIQPTNAGLLIVV